MDNSGTGGGLRAGFGLFGGGGGGGGGAGAAGGSVSDYSQPDLSRVPLTGMSPLSPYLNLDPRYLVHDNDEFILPTGANKTRGRFELAFFTIGGCCMTGAAIGAVNGLRLGLKETRDMNWSKPRNVHEPAGRILKTIETIYVCYEKPGGALGLCFGEDADSWRPPFLLALVKLSLLCWIVLVYRPPPLATDRVKWFWFIMYLLQGPGLQIILNMVTRQGALWANTLGSLALLYSTFGVVIEKVRGAEDDLNTMAAGSLTGLLYKSTAGLRGAARGGFIGLTLTGLYALYNNWDHIKGTSVRHSL